MIEKYGTVNLYLAVEGPMEASGDFIIQEDTPELISIVGFRVKIGVYLGVELGFTKP